jgi:hypothetical protein
MPRACGVSQSVLAWLLSLGAPRSPFVAELLALERAVVVFISSRADALRDSPLLDREGLVAACVELLAEIAETKRLRRGGAS